MVLASTKPEEKGKHSSLCYRKAENMIEGGKSNFMNCTLLQDKIASKVQVG